MAEVTRLEAELAQIRTGLQDTVKKMKNFGAAGDDEMIVRLSAFLIVCCVAVTCFLFCDCLKNARGILSSMSFSRTF